MPKLDGFALKYRDLIKTVKIIFKAAKVYYEDLQGSITKNWIFQFNCAER